jgi:DNA-directed RNA polymerase specialized sigma24 family protein
MIAPAECFGGSDDLDPVVRRIVGRKVQDLVRSGGIARQDARDFEQDLYVRLLERASDFDPQRSHRYAFATMVVARQATNLLRDRKAGKRDPQRVQQLCWALPIENEAFDQMDIAIDVAKVLAEMPEELRILAEQLKVMSRQNSRETLLHCGRSLKR